MRKLVIATTNINKIKRLSALLAGRGLEILSLANFDTNFEEPSESLNSPEAIAAQKALYYVSKLPKGVLVLTQDDALTFNDVAAKDDPKNHIKQPVEQKYGSFTDENAIRYYTELARKYGGTIDATFHYGHALVVRKDNARGTISLTAGKSQRAIRVVDRVNKPETVKGYFLAAISECQIDGKWVFYNDLTDEQSVIADSDLKQSIVALLERLGVNDEK
jgi:hypothetical protein